MVGVLRFRNSETGEWQEINAIKGDDYVLTQEDREEIAQLVGDEDFYTRAEIDNKLAELNAPNFDDYYKKNEVDKLLADVDVDLSDYYTKEEVNDKVDGIEVPAKVSQLENDAGYITADEIPESGPEYNFGEGLGYNEFNNFVFISGDDTIHFPNGQLSVNQDNLFTSGGFSCVAESFYDELRTITGEVWSVNVTKMRSPEDTQWFFENAQGKFIIAEVVLENGWFNANGTAKYFTNIAADDGVVYEVVLGMRESIYPELTERYGVLDIQIGYKQGEVYFIVVTVPNTQINDVRAVRFGESNIRRSLAHNYIGSYDHFRVENDQLFLNENYINNMIDNRINNIPRAEEVSV